MAPSASRPTIGSLFLLTISLFSIVSAALKFDIAAQQRGHRQRCIRNFVAKDTLVVVTATVSGHKGDGQQVNIHVWIYLLFLRSDWLVGCEADVN